MRRVNADWSDKRLLVPLQFWTHLYGVCKARALLFEFVLKTYA